MRFDNYRPMISNHIPNCYEPKGKVFCYIERLVEMTVYARPIARKLGQDGDTVEVGPTSCEH